MSCFRFARPSRALFSVAVASFLALPVLAAAQSGSNADSASVGTTQASLQAAIQNPAVEQGISKATVPVEAPVAAVSTSLMLMTAPAALSVNRDTPAPAAPLRKQDRSSKRTNTTLILVGAAAVIIGAAVGDDAGTILIVGGAGIGLFGLYRLLN